MAIAKTKKVNCPYTSVYRMLVEAQGTKKRPLSINTVYKHIQKTPGLLFSPGTTVHKILGKLENWRLIKTTGRFVKVIS